MKPCIVIGGGGFIGRAVVDFLCGTGRETIVLGRSSRTEHPLPHGCRYVSGDYGNHTVLRELLQREADVIDLAYSTVPKTSYGDPVFDLLSNLPPSVGLLQEAAQAGVGKIVLVSSGGTVYGPARRLPIDENHPTEPVSPYGITKVTIDRYAMMFHQNMDLPVCIARPANAYGESQRSGSGQGFLAAAIDSILSKRHVEIYGKNGTIRDYVHVSDVARGIIAVLELGVPGEAYNIGTGVGTCHADILEILTDLAQREGLEIKPSFLPERRFDVAANILDSSKLHRVSGWRHQIALRDGLHGMWNAFVSRRRAEEPSRI